MYSKKYIIIFFLLKIAFAHLRAFAQFSAVIMYHKNVTQAKETNCKNVMIPYSSTCSGNGEIDKDLKRNFVRGKILGVNSFTLIDNIVCWIKILYVLIYTEGGGGITTYNKPLPNVGHCINLTVCRAQNATLSHQPPATDIYYHIYMVNNNNKYPPMLTCRGPPRCRR